jgi:hypothetical protein
LERERLFPIAVVVAQVLVTQAGISLRRLRVAVRSLLGRCTDGDTDAALLLLGEGVRYTVGPRSTHQYALDMGKLPSDVLARLARPKRVRRPTRAGAIARPMR